MTTQKLQKSFSKQDDSGDLTLVYLNYMNTFQRECSRLETYSKEVTDKNGPLLETDKICQDLVKLSGNTEKIYTAALPLLKADSDNKRYKNIPPFKNYLRDRHALQAVQLQKQVSGLGFEDEYSSRAPQLAEDLKVSIESTADTSYLSALEKFQIQLMAERQHYWTNYADIAGLEQGLSTQLKAFCADLPSDKTACKTL